MNQVVQFSEFKFNSLHKYMAPLYSAMNMRAFSPDNEKKECLRLFIREFFVRLRQYRGRSLEEIAATASKIPFERFRAFEAGETPASREIENVYCKACCGDAEFEYFYHQLRAFKDPSIKDSCRAVAKDVLRKSGIMLPYVDYKNLGDDSGTILRFPK